MLWGRGTCTGKLWGRYQRCDEASGKLKSLLLNHNILEVEREGRGRKEGGGESRVIEVEGEGQMFLYQSLQWSLSSCPSLKQEEQKL